MNRGLPELKDRLRARFFILGGIPRYLFVQIDDSAATIIDRAFANTRWDGLTRIAQLNGVTEREEISHRIVHRVNEINIIGQYRDYVPQFASDYVAAMAAKIYSQEKHLSAVQFLDSTSAINCAGSLRGNIFEPLAHRCIRNGQNFTIIFG
jgi:hypothetical protein